MKYALISLMLFAFTLPAHARKPAGKVCGSTDKVEAAALGAFKKADEANASNAQYKVSTAKFDRWEVDVNYKDICYRTVTVFMKPGTCTEAKDPVKGHETCTDD